MPLERRSKLLWPKSRRRFHRNYRFLAWTLWLVGAGLLFWAVFFSPFLRVEHVVFGGQEGELQKNVEEETTTFLSERAFLFFPRNHLFVLWGSKAAFAKRLRASFPHVASVEASIDFPSTFRVFITSRLPIAVWCVPANAGEQCFWVDNEGVIFSDATSTKGRSLFLRVHSSQGSIPLLGQSVVASSTIQFLSDVYRQFQNEGFPFSEFYEGKTYYEGFRVQTPDGWEVIILPEGGVEEVVANLKLVLKKELKGKTGRLEYIDMRLINRVFYKLRQ